MAKWYAPTPDSTGESLQIEASGGWAAKWYAPTSVGREVVRTYFGPSTRLRQGAEQYG